MTDDVEISFVARQQSVEVDWLSNDARDPGSWDVVNLGPDSSEQRVISELLSRSFGLSKIRVRLTKETATLTVDGDPETTRYGGNVVSLRRSAFGSADVNTLLGMLQLERQPA